MGQPEKACYDHSTAGLPSTAENGYKWPAQPVSARSGIGLDSVLSFRTDFDQAPASSKPMRTEHLPLSAQATALIASIVETSDPESASYSSG
jgi:hypothetical protein